MKYTGTIIGLETSYGSIYNVVTDDQKCYLWKGNVEAEVKEKLMQIKFICDGSLYEMRLCILKTGYYTANIFCNKVDCGKAYLWEYKKDKDILLKGFFVEDGRNFDCFLELKPEVYS